MMEFGKALRAAREAKGLSIAQLAETTRLAPTTITCLENDDFQHIAAPIYGRGFVRLYCEAVGLDPKPFIGEYMEIMQGNRAPAIKERPSVMQEVRQPVQEAIPTPVATEPPHRQEVLFRQPLDQSSAPPPRPEPGCSAPASLSRYAAPMRTLGLTLSSTWRMALLAIGAGVALALLVFALRALHRATSPDKTTPETSVLAEEEAFATPVETNPKAPAATDKTPGPRELQSIPALYID